MKTIILDTNFIIHCIEFKIDFKSEIERIAHFKYSLAIIDKTIVEIKKLKNNLALQLIKDIKQIKSSESTVDKEIIKIANENTIIATQDKALKKAVKNKKAPIITIRQKTHLVLQNQNIY